MMRPALWALVAASILLLAGCPYESPHPLSDPGAAALDRALVGTWRSTDPESGAIMTLAFLPWNDRELVGSTLEPDPEAGTGKLTLFRAFVTLIDGERFLNLQELGSESGPAWNFAHCEISADRMTLRLLDDLLFEDRSFSSSDELREFVRRSLADPRLYGDPEDPQPGSIWLRQP
jgi:hypothetical protein